MQKLQLKSSRWIVPVEWNVLTQLHGFHKVRLSGRSRMGKALEEQTTNWLVGGEAIARMLPGNKLIRLFGNLCGE